MCPPCAMRQRSESCTGAGSLELESVVGNRWEWRTDTYYLEIGACGAAHIGSSVEGGSRGLGAIMSSDLGAREERCTEYSTEWRGDQGDQGAAGVGVESLSGDFDQ